MEHYEIGVNYNDLLVSMNIVYKILSCLCDSDKYKRMLLSPVLFLIFFFKILTNFVDWSIVFKKSLVYNYTVCSVVQLSPSFEMTLFFGSTASTRDKETAKNKYMYYVYLLISVTFNTVSVYH